jgi:hypothetical protein
MIVSVSLSSFHQALFCGLKWYLYI